VTVIVTFYTYDTPCGNTVLINIDRTGQQHSILGRHTKQWNRFSAKMPRQTKEPAKELAKELERQANSMKLHFVLRGDLVRKTDTFATGHLERT
jgi:hypothetical protein